MRPKTCEWLDHDPSLPAVIEGISVDREGTKTRVEEYTFVRDEVKELEPGVALDAATGYVPGWHVLPYILVEMGWEVDTVDFDERTLDMPEHPKISRMVSNITDLSFYHNEYFDLVTCISTLEHMNPEDQIKATKELLRVLRSGGMLILTADNYPGVGPALLANLVGIPIIGCRIEAVNFPGGKRVAVLSMIKP